MIIPIILITMHIIAIALCVVALIIFIYQQIDLPNHFDNKIKIILFSILLILNILAIINNLLILK
jgi:hypothetical protein